MNESLYTSLEACRRLLNEVVDGADCLYDEDVVELSKKVDTLLNKILKDTHNHIMPKAHEIVDCE